MEIHRSARKHGLSDLDIEHAFVGALVLADLDRDADPPKLLAIGPDRAANFIEIILLELAEGRLLAIHAMPLRKSFRDLLPKGDRDR